MLRHTSLLLLLLSGMGAGCGQAKKLPELFPVSGQVLKSGEPVAGGFVTFQAKDRQDMLIVNSPVDQQGKFTLTTVSEAGNRVAGAPKGEYAVTFSPPGASQRGKSAPTTVAQSIMIQGEASNLIIDIGDSK